MLRDKGCTVKMHFLPLLMLERLLSSVDLVEDVSNTAHAGKVGAG